MRVGRFCNIEVHFNLLFILLLGLYFVAGVLEKGLIIFGLVLFHELAHTLVATTMGVRVSEIELLPFGGVARVGTEMSVEPGKEITVALAGPAANLLLIGIALGLKNYGLWSQQLGPFFIQTNLLLAFFNLLPALPLDGGRVLRSLLAVHIGVSRATLVAARMGQVIALLIACLGVIGVINRFVGLDVVIVAIFVFYSASKERGLAPYLFVQHLAQKKEELSRNGVLPAEQMVAREDVLIKEIVRLFVPQKFHLVMLLDKEMNYLGQLSESQVVDALFLYGMNHPLGDLIKSQK